MEETHDLGKSKGWKVGEDFPEWGNNSLYLTTIMGGYLNKNETPKDAYQRIASATAKYYKKKETYDKIFNILWNGWLAPSTPVAANFGNSFALPISCFSGVVGDNMYDIFRKNTEIAMLSKNGGGTALDYSNVRAIGSPIRNGEGGVSDGIIPFIKVTDSTIQASKQGKLRRGALAIYLDSTHKEVPEFLRVRDYKIASERQCLNIHQGLKWSDEVMHDIKTKKGKMRDIWLESRKARIKTGEPYDFFTDNANKNLPSFWKNNNLKINHSNLCTEIFLPTDENHTLVCCLSSLNLAKYDEWKDTDTVFWSIVLLDAVIEEFITKAETIPGIEDTLRFAVKSRAVGLGALGWHTYLQKNNLPFISVASTSLTKIIFSDIQKKSEEATLILGNELGEPFWCKGTGRRNLTLLAIAPNRSSSKLCGDVSQGIEPIAANAYIDGDSKGMHLRRNPTLEKLLESKGKNNNKVWDQIAEDRGSVVNVRCLSTEEKEVFKTFKEINQLELVRQAAIRQKYIDQGQSINLAFFQDAPANFINNVHLEAHALGIKSLYYLRSESVLKADSKGVRDLYSECLMCEG